MAVEEWCGWLTAERPKGFAISQRSKSNSALKDLRVLQPSQRSKSNSALKDLRVLQSSQR